MQACRLHFMKARKWACESGSIVRACGGEKADDNKSCNNNDDEDLAAYFEALDKWLNNDNCNNNECDHNASKCNCCDLSDSMASDKEEGKCKKPEEVVYRKEICHKEELDMFNETQQNAILGCDKKQKKSVSKKTLPSRLALEKKRLEVEHERLELQKKKLERQQEKEGCELKLKQRELERLFELKKCERRK
uniref:Uncharacterized protein n=1 Tax=Glossina austeni TaxID=7395 RepID=A0A1A9VGE5_GLOAU